MPPAPAKVSSAYQAARPRQHGAHEQPEGLPGEQTSSEGGQPIIVGPEFPRPGVIGRGGVYRSNEVPDGPLVTQPTLGSAGVVGLAGDVAVPAESFLTNTGVHGRSDSGVGVRGASNSSIGVVGESTTAAGVSGINLSSDPANSAPGVEGWSSTHRGGVFTSEFAAQLRLVPRHLAREEPMPAGLPGDFLVTIDEDDAASLWFCTRAGAANWFKAA